MLARLQATLVLLMIALSAGLAAWALASGHPGWALLALLSVLTGWAALLALEFVLLAWVNRGGADPVAGVAQLVLAWWGEVRTAVKVFGWWQPFCSRRWDNRLPAGHDAKRGIVLVHGYFCNRGLWNAWMARLHAAGVPFTAVNLEPVFGSIDECTGSVDTAIARMRQHTGLAPVVVAHSMGGLVLRRWWQGVGEDAPVHRAITIGTPHQGTWLGQFGVSRNARQMRLGSRWLQQLAASEPASRAAHFTCFYGHCDNIVFPTATATLAGADNRHLAGVAHVQMVDHPAPYEEAMRWLRP